MATKYKYRHRETYKGHKLDIKGNSLIDVAKKIENKKRQIDIQIIDDNTKLSRLIDLYLTAHKEPTVSSRWLVELERMGNRFVKAIGDKPISLLKPLEAQIFLNSLSGMSESYIKKHFDFINQIFNFAYKNGMTASDYSLQLTKPKGNKSAEGRSLTSSERETLLKVLVNHRMEIFCKLMLFCGLRPSEAAALEWSDIDFDNRTLTVNKSRKRDNSIGEPKSSSGYRTIPIPEHFIDSLLEAYKNRSAKWVCEIHGSYYSEYNRIAGWKNVKRLMNIEMGCTVKNHQLIEPLPLSDDFKMYYLRHTYCTDLERLGVPINVARRLMGHSSIEVTSKIYTHASNETLEAVRDLLDEKHVGNRK